MSVVELSSGAVAVSYEIGEEPHGVGLSNDGQLLVTSRAESKLWVLDPESLDIIDEIPLEGIGHQISLESH